jgi:hypothetical protein
LAVQLAYAGYNLGLENDIIWNLVDCNDHLVPFFDRLGYEWTHRAYHDEYGVVNVMRLKINDRERLMEKRSVFVKHSRYFEELRTRGELAAGGMHV